MKTNCNKYSLREFAAYFKNIIRTLRLQKELYKSRGSLIHMLYNNKEKHSEHIRRDFPVDIVAVHSLYTSFID